MQSISNLLILKHQQNPHSAHPGGLVNTFLQSDAALWVLPQVLLPDVPSTERELRPGFSSSGQGAEKDTPNAAEHRWGDLSARASSCPPDSARAISIPPQAPDPSLARRSLPKPSHGPAQLRASSCHLDGSQDFFPCKYERGGGGKLRRNEAAK